MTVKDRFQEFLNRRRRSSLVCPIPNEVTGENLQLLLKRVDGIHDDLDRLESLVQRTEQLHSNIVASPGDNPDLRTSLDETRTNLLTLTSRVRQGVVSLQLKAGVTSPAEERVRQLQLHALTSRLNQTLQKLHASEVCFSEQSRKRLKRQMSLAGQHASEEELNSLMENGASAMFVDSILINTDLKCDLELCLSQEEQILRLERRILELQGQFCDLKDMVHQQGTTVDSIETHLDRTLSFLGNSAKLLKPALQFKKKFKKRKLLLIGGISLMIIIGLIAGVALLVL